MILAFSPAARELAPFPQGASITSWSPWFLITGQPMRLWVPGPPGDTAAPWLLGSIPLLGEVVLQIPDGLGVDGSLRCVAALIRTPSAQHADDVRAAAMPPELPRDHASAQALHREIARRRSRMARDVWPLAIPLAIPPRGWPPS